ncbi:hypothetical protein CR513_35410, partial [Mucuna pruriens]
MPLKTSCTTVNMESVHEIMERKMYMAYPLPIMTELMRSICLSSSRLVLLKWLIMPRIIPSIKELLTKRIPWSLALLKIEFTS